MLTGGLEQHQKEVRKSKRGHLGWFNQVIRMPLDASLLRFFGLAHGNLGKL